MGEAVFHGVALIDADVSLEDATNQEASVSLEDAVVQTHLEKGSESERLLEPEVCACYTADTESDLSHSLNSEAKISCL